MGFCRLFRWEVQSRVPDYYWDLVTGSVCRSEGGPTAIHTKLGWVWVLSGPTPAKDQAQCSMNLTTTHVLRAETQELESTALDELSCEWVERAPWWGGVFERMVKSTKRCLRKVIGRAHLSQDELLTAVTEIEAVINSRPLSYISANDLEEALTPSHLIVVRRIPDHIEYLCDSTEDEEFSINATQLAKRVKHLSSTYHFWNRWRTEYLAELRVAHEENCQYWRPQPVNWRYRDRTRTQRTPTPWTLEAIQELMKGQDGQFRGATVKMATRGRQQTLLHRPIQLLYPLEVRCPEMPTNDAEEPDTEQEADVVTEDPVETRQRTTRVAAQKADERGRLNWKTIELKELNL